MSWRPVIDGLREAARLIATGDREVIEALGPERIDEIFDPAYYVRYADSILRHAGIL